MFLKQTIHMNEPLIHQTIHFHQTGELLPDTYVLDLDTFRNNAKLMLDKANNNSIELLFMLKQVGHNPLLAKELMALGYKGAVVVDFKEALVLMRHNIPLKNVGHLVQVPRFLLKKIISYGTEYFTVYSLDIIKEIDEISSELGITQKIMLRVINQNDIQYSGQHAGFTIAELTKVVKEVQSFKHVSIEGLTSFPCLLFNPQVGNVVPTPNIQTLVDAKSILKNYGINISNLNMPSVTSLAGLDILAKYGANQGEPGHSLTGTTPLNATSDNYETPAWVYLSEISHTYSGKSYFYGGGLYRRGHMENILITDENHNQWQTKITPFPMDSIDYYFNCEGLYPYGASVIMAYRTQLFVTRSNLAIVEGIHTGNPRIIAIYDSQGNKVEED